MNYDARLRELHEMRDNARRTLIGIDEEIRKLELRRGLAEFTCECVRRNGDVEIEDMQEQTRRRRNPLGPCAGGFVSDTLSARLDCSSCNGTGVPK